jgi:aryl-alcohol dehydrogenase-like predicted oxidoreductase
MAKPFPSKPFYPKPFAPTIVDVWRSKLPAVVPFDAIPAALYMPESANTSGRLAVNVHRSGCVFACIHERSGRKIPASQKAKVMKYRKLGASDLEVSEIALGSWLTYGVGVEQDAARACIDRAFDLGINFIDTANVYGRGATETFLGDALSTRPRDSYVLATKVFFPMSDADKGLSAAQIHKQIDASLQRLQTDHVDLYQCHRYDADTPLEETMAALSEVVRLGKARYIGFSEWSPAQIEAAFAISGVECFVSSQPQYSLLHRRPEAKVIPFCAANGVSQIVWSPLAQGVLTGKYEPGARLPTDSRAASDTMGSMMTNWLRPEVLAAVHKLKPLARQANCTMTQFALAWVLREPNVASAIVGASRPEQLDENAAASGLAIDPVLFEQAEALVADIG